MKRAVIVATFFVLGLIADGLLIVAQTPAPSTLPLVQPADLVYQGAFRMPAVDGFGYSEAVTGFHPAHNSLFMLSHDWYQLVGEISIPATFGTGAISTLPRATLLQPLVDVTEGGCALINPGDPNAKKIGGLLVYQGKLYADCYAYYDGSGSAVLSHFVSGLDLSVKGDATGPFQVGTTVGTPVTHKSAGFVAGPMALVPPEWQAPLGGPVLTGRCCLAVTTRSSWGPAAFAIDPTKLGVTVPLPAKALVAYPAEFPLAQWASQNTLYNGTAGINGIVFPAGTRSVLFFGAIGTGPWCYGAGTTNQALDGTLTPDGVTKYCYDPTNQSKGTHAYPHRYQVWAYDANELAKVAAGQITPWSVRPYAVWELSLPYTYHGDGMVTGPTGFAGPLGAAYDPATGRLFIAQARAEDSVPVVHVFKLAISAPPPPPPPQNTDCVVSWPAYPDTWTTTATDLTRCRTATITTPQSGTGAACPVLTECEHQPLPVVPVDCVVSAWGPFSAWVPFTTTPPQESRTRTRTIVTQPVGTGAVCPVLTETEIRPTPVVLLTITGAVISTKDCTLQLEDTPPDALGGWKVQFYRNAGITQGIAIVTPDADGKYRRSATVPLGNYAVYSVWTKPGQQTVTRAPKPIACQPD